MRRGSRVERKGKKDWKSKPREEALRIGGLEEEEEDLLSQAVATEEDCLSVCVVLQPLLAPTTIAIAIVEMETRRASERGSLDKIN